MPSSTWTFQIRLYMTHSHLCSWRSLWPNLQYPFLKFCCSVTANFNLLFSIRRELETLSFRLMTPFQDDLGIYFYIKIITLFLKLEENNLGSFWNIHQMICNLELLQAFFFFLHKWRHYPNFLWISWFNELIHFNESNLLRAFVVQLLSCNQLFVTSWTAAHQASLSFTI